MPHIAIAANEIEVTVSPDSSIYENGKPLNYQIELVNKTAKTLSGVRVSDPVWDTPAIAESGTKRAFSQLDITSQHTWGSSAGVYESLNTNLVAQDVKLLPYGRVTYSVSAIPADDIVEDIVLGATEVSAQIDGSTANFKPTSGSVFKPVPYEYTLTLDVDSSEYALGQVLTYNLTVENTGSYDLQGLDINLPMSSLAVENNTGTKVSPFSSVSIVGGASGSYSDLGNFTTSGDLVVSDAKVVRGGRIVYTLTATVIDNLVGDIEVMAKSKTKEGDEQSNALVTPPAQPDVSITQQVDSTNPYLVSQLREFTINVTNNGQGIAHDYQVTHNISNMLTNLGLGNDLQPQYDHTDVTGNPFSTWQVEVTKIGGNTSSSYASSGIQSNVDFADTISLYPGESIQYALKATISPVAIGTIQGASAAVFDQIGSLVEDTQISTPITAKKVLNVSDPEIRVTKTTKESEYIPGNQVEYLITVENSSSQYFANDLAIVDDLTCIQTEQAGGAGQGRHLNVGKWMLSRVKIRSGPIQVNTIMVLGRPLQ